MRGWCVAVAMVLSNWHNVLRAVQMASGEYRNGDLERRKKERYCVMDMLMGWCYSESTKT